MKDERELDEPELGRVLTIPVHPANIRQHPYQRAEDRSWGSYEVEPVGNTGRGAQGLRYVLPATAYQPHSARSFGSRGGFPYPLLPINTATTRAVARTSYSDSEFSQNQIPVSPERYGDALKIIDGDRPKILENPNLSTLENTRAHERREEVKAERTSNTSEDDQQNVPYTALVREPSSHGLNNLAWSPALSNDEAQIVALASHSDQDFNAPVDLSRSVGFPRYVLGAVDPPFTAPPASSSSSISTNILDSLSPLAKNSEYAMETVHLPSGPSASSSDSNSTDPDAPFINIELPEGNIDCEPSLDLQSASISRYSGFVVDDTGFRQVSEGEIEAEPQATMNTFGESTESKQTIFSLSQESSQAGTSMHVRDDDHFIAEQQSLPLRRSGQRITNLDPGSSQTSSSMSADRLTRATSSREGKADFYKESSSSSQLRSPTPPLLYERRRTMASHSVEDGGHLAQSYPLGFEEEDWETVSDMRGITRGSNNGAVANQAGSSLVDSSDPGDPSTIEAETGGPRNLGASQHPGLPRHHHAFLIMKDNRSGGTSNIPLHDFQEGHLYRHPISITGKHLNPFRSSPPIPQILQTRVSIRSNSTGGFDKLIDSYGSINDSRNGQDVADVREGTKHQDKRDFAPKEPSPGSSTWLSTVSESASSEDPSLPPRSGSFAKVTVLNAKGNLTGTPKGTGAREVGSSLAGASSPRDQFPSSPESPLGSIRLLSVVTKSPQIPRQHAEAHPLTMPEVPSSLATGVYTSPRLQTVAPLTTFQASTNFACHHQTSSNQKIPDQTYATPDASSIHSSRAPFLNGIKSADSDAQLRLTSRARALNFEGPSKQRRRRSSVESDYKAMASPLTIKASASPSPDQRGHQKRNTMVALLSSHSPSDDVEPEKSQHQTTVRERQGHQGTCFLMRSFTLCTQSLLRSTSMLLFDAHVGTRLLTPYIE